MTGLLGLPGFLGRKAIYFQGSDLLNLKSNPIFLEGEKGHFSFGEQRALLTHSLVGPHDLNGEACLQHFLSFLVLAQCSLGQMTLIYHLSIDQFSCETSLHYVLAVSQHWECVNILHIDCKQQLMI